jgi:hypothetical protein
MACLRLAARPLSFAISVVASAQVTPPISIDTAQKYFAEAGSLCHADDGKLWGISLCGRIMFVDPGNRPIVAGDADAKGALKPEGGVVVGSLPADQTMANAAVEWSGVHWTQSYGRSPATKVSEKP